MASEVGDISVWICEISSEPTDRPLGAVGRGRRPFYGRLCACDREDGGFRERADITGTGPMAEFLGITRKQFNRIRSSDPKRFHLYSDNSTSVISLTAWPDLYEEHLSEGIARRMQNLKQFGLLETLVDATDETGGFNVGSMSGG